MKAANKDMLEFTMRFTEPRSLSQSLGGNAGAVDVIGVAGCTGCDVCNFKNRHPNYRAHSCYEIHPRPSALQHILQHHTLKCSFTASSHPSQLRVCGNSGELTSSCTATLIPIYYSGARVYFFHRVFQTGLMSSVASFSRALSRL